MNIRIMIMVIICFLTVKASFVHCANSSRIAGARYPGTYLGMKVEQTRNSTQEERQLKSKHTARQAKKVSLHQLDQETLQTMLSHESSKDIIGVSREINVLKEQQGMQWNKLPQGGVTSSFLFTSPGAAALRIGIAIHSLPFLAELRFFQGNMVNEQAEVAVKGREINRLIQLNMQAEPDNPSSNVYWSPVIAGESLGIEIYLPQNVESQGVQLTFPMLSHFAVSPFSSSEHQFINQSYGDSSTCQNDATCYPAWLDTRDAVAKMVYTEFGDSYTCSGTLLNDADATTWKPYFISANHCIASQTVASTLQTVWFFESSTCNGITRNANYAIRNGGATLLWTEGTTKNNVDSNQDASFFKLHDLPPAGAYYAGWNISFNFSELVGIHHPAGDWKKISFGEYAEMSRCYLDSNDLDFYCTPSFTGSFLQVNWTTGGTEPGSSGSGIFSSTKDLVGMLKGGNGGCDDNAVSIYSTFSAAYSAGNLGQWLNTAPSPDNRASIVPILMLLSQ